MSQFKAVLFDLDGTLADTAPALGLALNMQRERHGLPALPIPTIRPYASHGSRGLLEIGFGMAPDHPDYSEMRYEYLVLYDQIFTESPLLFEGIPEVLAELERQRIRWGIVTNKPRRFTLPLMKALKLHKRAACIVSGDDAARPKPYPDPLLMACDIARLKPEGCLYVGDAERDIKAGREAGMQTAVARYGYLGQQDQPQEWGAQLMIDSPLELLNRISG